MWHSTFVQFPINCGRTLLKMRNVRAPIRQFSSEKINPKLEEHQKHMMARGLPKQRPINGVKHIVLVSSGKGGVGKSTVAVNLATAIKYKFPNKNIGLLDTDVFGPSIPLMMNLHQSPIINKEKLMEPLVNYGVKCMSMGFLVDEESPIIWRGLMVMQALEKLMRQVAWDSIDILIVDTPPGTGDTHLTLIQNLPISGVVLVTTPQTAAVQVAQRGANMFRKLSIPIIGVVENMSTVKCPSCSTMVNIFGTSENTTAQKLNTKLLLQIPIEDEVAQTSDRGIPFIINSSNSNFAKGFTCLAENIVQFVDQSK